MLRLDPRPLVASQPFFRDTWKAILIEREMWIAIFIYCDLWLTYLPVTRDDHIFKSVKRDQLPQFSVINQCLAQFIMTKERFCHRKQ